MEKLVVIDQVIQSVFLLMDPLSPLVLLIMMAMELVWPCTHLSKYWRSWTQVGSDIDGEAAGDFRVHLSLSADVSFVAIGAYSNDGNGDNSGHVRIYQNIGGTWTQVGSDIDGEAAGEGLGDFSGGSVSLSADGSVIAIGADSNDDNGNGSGHVRIYQNIGGTWTQVGSDIDGEAAL